MSSQPTGRRCSAAPVLLEKAKHTFEERPQFFLVVFTGGEFAEFHPLFLICQIDQISCGTSSCTIRNILLMLG